MLINSSITILCGEIKFTQRINISSLSNGQHQIDDNVILLFETIINM